MAAIAGAAIAAVVGGAAKLGSAKIQAKATEAVAERQQQTQLAQIFGQLYGGLAIPEDAELTDEAVQTIMQARQFQAAEKAATLRASLMNPIQQAGVGALANVASSRIAAAPQASPGGVFNLRFA